MATDLNEYVDTLRRELTTPGGTLYTDVEDEVFTDYLVDAFWQARLDGFFLGYDVTADGIVNPAPGVAEMPREAIAVLTLYAAIKIIRNRILSTQTRFRAAAGPVTFETDNSPSLYIEMLRQLSNMKDKLVELGPNGSHVSYVALVDGFAGRSVGPDAYLGWAGAAAALPGGY